MSLERKPAEIVRAQVLTYLKSLDGNEVTNKELASDLNLWHMRTAAVLKGLVKRGRVRQRPGEDGKPLYRIGEEQPEAATLTLAQRLDALEARLANWAARLDAANARALEAEQRLTRLEAWATGHAPQASLPDHCEGAPDGSAPVHARDNQGRCHWCGVEMAPS